MRKAHQRTYLYAEWAFTEPHLPRRPGSEGSHTRRAESSMPASTSCVAAVLGDCCPMASQRGRLSTIIPELGASRRYLAEVARALRTRSWGPLG